MNMMGRLLTPKKHVLTDQFNEYMEYCECIRRFTPYTIRSKRQIIQKFLVENPGLTDFRNLTNEQFDAWIAKLVKEGKTGKTVNNNADQVIALLRYFQNKRGQKIALRLEAVERCEEDPPQTTHFSIQQIQLIKGKCRGLRELLLVSLIFESGMRISEIKNLRANNLRGNEMVIVGKGRKERSVFIQDGTLRLLEQWLLLAGVADDGYIFPSPVEFDAPLSVLQIRASINAPIHRAGLEGSAHAIRRGTITALLDNGMSLQDVSKIAGHSDPQTTLKHYYRVSNKELGARFAQAMESVGV